MTHPTTMPEAEPVAAAPRLEYARRYGAYAVRYSHGGPWAFDPELAVARDLAVRLARKAGLEVADGLPLIPVRPAPNRGRFLRTIANAARQFAAVN